MATKFSVPLDANVSVEVVVRRKSDTLRNFPSTLLQCPVVLTSLKASLVTTTVSTFKHSFFFVMTTPLLPAFHVVSLL